jgi:hypothetical protein
MATPNINKELQKIKIIFKISSYINDFKIAQRGKSIF